MCSCRLSSNLMLNSLTNKHAIRSSVNWGRSRLKLCEKSTVVKIKIKREMISHLRKTCYVYDNAPFVEKTVKATVGICSWTYYRGKWRNPQMCFRFIFSAQHRTYDALEEKHKPKRKPRSGRAVCKLNATNSVLNRLQNTSFSCNSPELLTLGCVC